MKRTGIVSAGFVAVVLTTVTGFAMGILYLPPGFVTASHGPWNQGSNSTIDVTLADVPDVAPPYDVTNGGYPGWCIEDNHQPDLPDGSPVLLLDSTDSDPLQCGPGDFPGVPWDQVNYLLNHKQGANGDVLATVEDIQAAMWIVAGTDDPSAPTFPETPEVTALVADAQLFGLGFIPGPGDLAAVILCADGLGPGGFQDTLIEVGIDDGGGEGCTPGYWKQRHHFSSWTNPPADPATTTFFDVFSRVPTSGDLLLVDALATGGGGERALLRHGAAAYLNAINPDVDFFFSAGEVIAMVQSAFDTGEFEATKDMLEYENEKGCPLSTGGRLLIDRLQLPRNR